MTLRVKMFTLLTLCPSLEGFQSFGDSIPRPYARVHTLRSRLSPIFCPRSQSWDRKDGRSVHQNPFHVLEKHEVKNIDILPLILIGNGSSRQNFKFLLLQEVFELTHGTCNFYVSFIFDPDKKIRLRPFTN